MATPPVSTLFLVSDVLLGSIGSTASRLDNVVVTLTLSAPLGRSIDMIWVWLLQED
jgi:hypothetical protein